DLHSHAQGALQLWQTELAQLLLDDSLSSHVRAQGFGNRDADVLLLVILDDGHPGAANCEPAAIQGVDELGLPFGALEPDAGSARLEGFEIRAGRNLLVTVLAGQPDFDVV